jgi:hypothetical protein
MQRAFVLDIRITSCKMTTSTAHSANAIGNDSREFLMRTLGNSTGPGVI